MTNLERLIESLEYSQDGDQKWYEVFDSLEEAESVLTSANKEEPEEHQLAFFLTMFDDDIMFSEDLNKVYRLCMKKLKKELRKAQK
jgi:hypothetical protein